MTSRLLSKVLFCAVAIVPLAAQVDRTSLTGTVTDPSGSVVPGAKIIVVSSGTGLRRETMTGESGAYQIPSLAIGSYTVTISKEGFHAAEYKDVELEVGQTRTLDSRLAIGA